MLGVKLNHVSQSGHMVKVSVVGVFTGFSKAFDTVDYDIYFLQKKNDKYGMCGVESLSFEDMNALCQQLSEDLRNIQ